MSSKLHLDFLVIGAQKAGTTSLHDWLLQHDDISLPAIKETHYFSHHERFERGDDWYLAQFVSGNSTNTLIGEVDPEYLFSSVAPERIKRLTDVNKFVIILRHPLERAYSQYLMSVRRGFEELPFDEAISAENDRLDRDGDFALDHQSYVSRSLYSSQIQRYVSLFPDARFLFIKFDDLMDKEKGDAVYMNLSNFIGSSQDVSLIDRASSSNQAAAPRWTWLRDLIYRKGDRSKLRKLFASLISDDLKLKLFLFVDNHNQRKLDKARMKSVTDFYLDQKIVSNILADLDKVEGITGLPLSDWKASISRDFVKQKGRLEE